MPLDPPEETPEKPFDRATALRLVRLTLEWAEGIVSGRESHALALLNLAPVWTCTKPSRKAQAPELAKCSHLRLPGYQGSNGVAERIRTADLLSHSQAL